MRLLTALSLFCIRLLMNKWIYINLLSGSFVLLWVFFIEVLSIFVDDIFLKVFTFFVSESLNLVESRFVVRVLPIVTFLIIVGLLRWLYRGILFLVCFLRRRVIGFLSFSIGFNLRRNLVLTFYYFWYSSQLLSHLCGSFSYCLQPRPRHHSSDRNLRWY